MTYPGFCGGSFVAQSPLVDCERLVNLYPEQRQTQGQHGDYALYPVGGFSTFVTVGDVGTRALWADAGRCFAIIGPTLYELFVGRTATNRGTVVQDGNPATISYNGATGGQLFITSGGTGYCYVLATNVLTVVLAGEATMGGMVNAYFLAFNSANGKVRISNLNDGTTWLALQYFQRTAAPDAWQTMQIRGTEVVMIGSQTGEVWHGVASGSIPFAPYQGVVFPYGVISSFGAGVSGPTVTWVSQNKDGQGIIVAMPGYVPDPISNYALETAVSGYARTSSISNAEFLTYQDDGHPFTVVSFPSVPACWANDGKTSIWHERDSLNPLTGLSELWKPRVHCQAFGLHLTGDRTTGTIAIFDQSNMSELDGSAIRRLRIPSPLWATSRTEGLRVDRFELICEPGLGTLAGQGQTPKAMLRGSRDTKTFGTLRTAGAGPQANYLARCVWNRCGGADSLWVPEITMTDPIAWRRKSVV